MKIWDGWIPETCRYTILTNHAYVNPCAPSITHFSPLHVIKTNHHKRHYNVSTCDVCEGRAYVWKWYNEICEITFGHQQISDKVHKHSDGTLYPDTKKYIRVKNLALWGKHRLAYTRVQWACACMQVCGGKSATQWSNVWNLCWAWTPTQNSISSTFFETNISWGIFFLRQYIKQLRFVIVRIEIESPDSVVTLIEMNVILL